MTNQDEIRVAEAALVAVDAIAGIVSMDYRAARVGFELVGAETLRLTDVESTLDARTPLPPRGEIGEQFEWIAAANEAFRRLRAHLHLHENKSWDGGFVEIKREPLVHAEVRLLDTKGALCHAIKLDASLARGQLLTETMTSFFAASKSIWAEQEAALRTRLRDCDFSRWRASDGNLHFHGKKGFPETRKARFIGSFAPDKTWCWSWANPSIPEGARAPLGSVRERARAAEGMGALFRPGFCCSSLFAESLAHVAVNELGEGSLLPLDDGGRTIYVALLD